MNSLEKCLILFVATFCALATYDSIPADERKRSKPTIVISFDGAQPGVI